jgi:hypothetical protein
VYTTLEVAMATSWRLSNSESALHEVEFLQKLEPFGIKKVAESSLPEGHRRFQISDGVGYMWCHPSPEGMVEGFETFVDSANPTETIREAIEEVCQEVVLSEHDEEFWEGMDTEDEEEMC